MDRILLAILCLITLNSYAQELDREVIVFSKNDELSLIGEQVFFLVDSSDSYEIEDILSEDLQEQFEKGERAYSNFPSTQYGIWAKVTLKNESDSDLILRIGKGWIPVLDFYKPEEDNDYSLTKTGYLREFGTREYVSNHFKFMVAERDDTTTNTFYVKMRPFGYVLEAPFYLGTTQGIEFDQQKEDWITALFSGAVIIMMLYSLIIFLSTNEKSHLYYFLYLGTLLFMMPYLTGAYPQFWLYRYWGDINFFYAFVASLNPLFITLFVNSFFSLEWRKNKIIQGTYVLCFVTLILGLINLVSGLTNNYEWWLADFSTAFLLSGSLYYLSILVLVIDSYRRGLKQARYLVIGWTIYFIAIWLVIGAYELEIFPLNFFTTKIIMIGSFLEIVMFSMALTDRMNILKEDKKRAQLLAMSRALENEKIVKKQNEILEKKVRERTYELASVNRDLKKKKKNLEELVVEKEGLMGIVAHDLASPLNGIQGFANLAMKEIGDSSALKKYVERVSDLSSNGKQLIQDLLTVSASVKTISEAEIELILVQDFLEGVLEPFALLAKEKNILFETDMHLETDVTIKSEVASVRRIVENLVSNAIKFCPIGGNVNVQVEAAHSSIFLLVKDSGPGFTEEDREKMFKKFQQLSAKPTNRENSTGLGLSIVKALCDRIGSSIKLNDTSNGAEFEVEFCDLIAKEDKVNLQTNNQL